MINISDKWFKNSCLLFHLWKFKDNNKCGLDNPSSINKNKLNYFLRNKTNITTVVQSNIRILPTRGKFPNSWEIWKPN